MGWSVLSSVAIAAGAPLSDLLELNLDELMQIPVSTATRRTEPVGQVPGTTLVISQADIRRRGYRNLFELLRDLPGIDVQGYSNATFYNRVAVRGLTGNNKLLILQDGVRISAPAGEPVPIAGNYPLHHVQQVEIVYGPTSAAYGADAVSGVINLITSTHPAHRQLGLYQAEDEGTEQQVHISEQTDSWQWSASGHWQQQLGPDLQRAYPDRFPMDDLVDFNGVSQIPAAARRPYENRSESRSQGVRIAHERDFELGVWQRQFRHPTTAGDRSALTEYGGYWAYTQRNVWGRGVWDVSRAAELQLLLDYGDYELDNQSHFLNAITGYQHGYQYAASERWHGEVQWSQALGERDHVVAGVTAERVHAIPKTTDLQRPYNLTVSPVAQDLSYLGSNNQVPVVLFDVAYNSQGVFVQHQRQWTHRCQSLAGLRYDHSETYDGQWTPRVSLSCDTAARWRLHASYAEAFLAPSPYFVWEHYGTFDGSQDAQGRYISPLMHIPNPALRPESVATTELGARWQPADNWQLSAALYHSELDDLIGLVPMLVPASDFVPGGVILQTTQNANVGALRVNGADLWLRHGADFGALGNVQNWLAISWADGRLSSPGLRQAIPFVARHTLKLGTSWEPVDKVIVTLNVIASDKVSALQSVALPIPAGAPGYAVAHLHTRVADVLPGLDLLFDVENLFDKRYYNAGDNVTTTLAASPQNPRIWTIGARFRF